MKSIDGWKDSEEYLRAVKDWIDSPEESTFTQSKEFRNARLAFRRRINGSPWNETT